MPRVTGSTYCDNRINRSVSVLAKGTLSNLLRAVGISAHEGNDGLAVLGVIAVVTVGLGKVLVAI